jgi:multisubunit Na+/H+ antiporter MnhB subunit
MRYAPLIAIALVGWALAILGIVELDAAVAFSGVALTTLAVVLGFVRRERGAERRESTGPRSSASAAPGERHATLRFR